MHGWRDALRADPAPALGLSTHEGALTSHEVGQAHDIEVMDVAAVLS